MSSRSGSRCGQPVHLIWVEGVLRSLERQRPMCCMRTSTASLATNWPTSWTRSPSSSARTRRRVVRAVSDEEGGVGSAGCAVSAFPQKRCQSHLSIGGRYEWHNNRMRRVWQKVPWELRAATRFQGTWMGRAKTLPSLPITA